MVCAPELRQRRPLQKLLAAGAVSGLWPDLLDFERDIGNTAPMMRLLQRSQKALILKAIQGRACHAVAKRRREERATLVNAPQRSQPQRGCGQTIPRASDTSQYELSQRQLPSITFTYRVDFPDGERRIGGKCPHVFESWFPVGVTTNNQGRKNLYL